MVTVCRQFDVAWSFWQFDEREKCPVRHLGDLYLLKISNFYEIFFFAKHFWLTILVKNWNVGQKMNFWSKIIFWAKNEILDEKFCCNFWWKIKNFITYWKFRLKFKIMSTWKNNFFQKSQFQVFDFSNVSLIG